MSKRKAIAKSTPTAATAAMINQVVRWIAAGGTEHEIAEAIAMQWPKAEPKPLIVEAMQQLAQNAEASPDLVRGWAFEAVREIYRRAMDANDLAVALRATQQLVQLAG